MHREWALSEASLRFADAVYVDCAERHRMALLTMTAGSNAQDPR